MDDLSIQGIENFGKIVPRICAPIHDDVPRIHLHGFSWRSSKIRRSKVPGFDLGLGFRVSCCDLTT